MKTTERYLGLLLENTQVTAIELAHSPKGYTLTAAGSFTSTVNLDDEARISQEAGASKREKTLAQELTAFFRKVGVASRNFAFALNSRMVMLQTVPVDITMSETETESHGEWELKQFFSKVDPDMYVVNMQMLDSDPEQNTGVATIVGVRKGFVNFLSHVCTHFGSNLNIVDIDQFAAENALLFNYPETKQRRTLLVGVDENSFDASIVVDGQTKNVITVRWDRERDMTGLGAFARPWKPEVAYFHGRIVSPAMLAAARELLPCNVDMMDPFRKVALPKSLANYDEVSQRRQSYAAAVGLALRTE